MWTINKYAKTSKLILKGYPDDVNQETRYKIEITDT
jgi:hypothetical protein